MKKRTLRFLSLIATTSGCGLIVDAFVLLISDVNHLTGWLRRLMHFLLPGDQPGSVEAVAGVALVAIGWTLIR